MPTMEARSEYLGAMSMPAGSHITNESASVFVRTLRADRLGFRSYSANMARRGIPKKPPAWFLREWMVAAGVKKQSDMMRLTGWSKATMSQLYNGLQDISTPVLVAASSALNCDPAELLMHPERAMAIRRLRETAAVIVSDSSPAVTEESKTGTNG